MESMLTKTNRRTIVKKKETRLKKKQAPTGIKPEAFVVSNRRVISAPRCAVWLIDFKFAMKQDETSEIL